VDTSASSPGSYDYDIAKIDDFPTGSCFPLQTVVLGCFNATQDLSDARRGTTSPPNAAPFADAIFWTPGRDAFCYESVKFAINFFQ
jgi:hypothetical protein